MGFAVVMTTFQYELSLWFYQDGWSVWRRPRTRTGMLTRQIWGHRSNIVYRITCGFSKQYTCVHYVVFKTALLHKALFCSHFADKKTEGQKLQGIGPTWHNWWVAESGSKCWQAMISGFLVSSFFSVFWDLAECLAHSWHSVEGRSEKRKEKGVEARKSYKLCYQSSQTKWILLRLTK